MLLSAYEPCVFPHPAMKHSLPSSKALLGRHAGDTLSLNVIPFPSPLRRIRITAMSLL